MASLISFMTMSWRIIMTGNAPPTKTFFMTNMKIVLTRLDLLMRKLILMLR